MTPHDLDLVPSLPLLRPLRWSTPLVNGQEPGGALALPAGTVTFLLTDIESSTLQWQAAPGPMAAAVARHYELLDQAIAAHGGVRPEEQGEGDSVVAAFSRASDALGAALAAQQLLHAEDWPTPEPVRVRMAVHTGEAQLRDDANYVGMAIIRTARLRNIAHGGQVLVSSASRDLALDQLGDQIALVDLGEHRLKDLARPERVYQLAHPDLPAAFDPLTSLDSIPNNLPLHLSTFIGRQDELAALHALVTGNRLVTITGSGGAGKTRLALQAAADLADRFGDGVWWVELAPLATGAEVPAAVAAAVGVREDGTTPAAELVANRLAGTASLLVLDNCEHVLDASADLVGTLLARCPDLRVVTTSRTVLDVPGEVTWRVPPLQLPDPAEPVAIERLGQFDAVRLFLDRARRARPTFALTDENAAAVAELCARLDGIPLAIELAAARTKSLTPQQICDGLGDALRLLTGGSRVVLPRQQTLEASIAWSEALLAERERALLRRLSVFSGSFDLVAAEAVCAGAGLDPMEVLDGLERLLDHSLVVHVDHPGGSRFVLLETVRQFGTRMLAEAGEDTSLRERHARHFATWARERSPLTETAQQVEVVDALDTDAPNVRAALAWHRTEAPADEFGQFACELGAYWDLGGHEAEADLWFTRALDGLPDRPSVLRARLLALRAEARLGLGRFEECLIDAVAAEAEGVDLGDDRAAGRAAWTLAAMTGYVDLDEWRTISDRSIERLARSGDRWALTEARVWQAVPHLQRGRNREGLAALDAAWPDVEELGNPTLLSGWLLWRSFALLGAGELLEARRLAELAARGGGVASPAHQSQQYFCLAMPALLLGWDDPLLEEAEPRFRASIRDGEGLATASYAFLELERLAVVGAHEQVRSLVAVLAALPSAGLPMFSFTVLAAELQAAFALGDDAEVDRLLPLARDAALASQGPFQEAVEATNRSLVLAGRGEPMAAEAAAHEGLALGEHGLDGYLSEPIEALAVALAAGDDLAGAARVAGIGAGWRDRIGLVARPDARARPLATALARCRAELGDDGFDTAFEEGRRLDADEALAFLRRTRGERRRPNHGWDSLTPTELQVVELVRQGLTNRAIAEQLLMGAETVKTHLSHVFTKVGVRSRSALAALAAERSAR